MPQTTLLLLILGDGKRAPIAHRPQAAGAVGPMPVRITPTAFCPTCCGHRAEQHVHARAECRLTAPPRTAAAIARAVAFPPADAGPRARYRRGPADQRPIDGFLPTVSCELALRRAGERRTECLRDMLRYHDPARRAAGARAPSGSPRYPRLRRRWRRSDRWCESAARIGRDAALPQWPATGGR